MPDITDLALLVDLHKVGERQGPGGIAETAMAIDLANLANDRPLDVLDIGAGTGASTVQLAKSLDALVTAVDLAPEFIEILGARAQAAGVNSKVESLVASMDDLPFSDERFDLIWSEGAVYNMGFERGVGEWRQLLAPGGTLVVSEITWTTAARPQVLEHYWEEYYPEIGTAAAKLAILEKCGYSPIGYFVLPEHCWLDNYYDPLQEHFQEFLQRHESNPRALALVEEEKQEIALYNQYKPYYSYGMYVARKV